MSSSAADDLARGRALMRCNFLVARFCAYGLLKNLKFFEPFLIVVLTKWGLSLAAIGGLVSVEKITCYVAELPSGYIADRCGARRTLCSTPANQRWATTSIRNSRPRRSKSARPFVKPSPRRETISSECVRRSATSAVSTVFCRWPPLLIRYRTGGIPRHPRATDIRKLHAIFRMSYAAY